MVLRKSVLFSLLVLLSFSYACNKTIKKKLPNPDTLNAEIKQVCAKQPAPTDNGEACQFTAGDANLLVHADIITPDGILQGGQVLVNSEGKIVCSECDCSNVSESQAAGVLSCPGAVVSPGLINSHDHLSYNNQEPKSHGTEHYDHRHEWRIGQNGHNQINYDKSVTEQASVQFSELRFVLSGATSTVASNSANNLLRNLDDDHNQLGLGKPAIQYETFPLGDSSGTRRTNTCDYGTLTTIKNAQAPFYPHVSEGVDFSARNEFLCLNNTINGGKDLINGQTSLIHAIGLNARDIMLLAQEKGVSVIWSPRSNIDLYGYTAQVSLMDQQGINVALGTDWIISGSMNMLRELRCAQDLNNNQFNKYFSDKKLVDMATINAAKAAKMEDIIGQLTPQHFADMAIFKKSISKKNYRAVLDADASDVVLVLRGGVALYGDANLLAAMGGDDSKCENLDVCGSAKRVCVKQETGKTLAELTNAAKHKYDLFSCESKPKNEPSCVPARLAENEKIKFSGVYADNDTDGDGFPNEQDNCPLVFNPARPLDKQDDLYPQADFDGDGQGDLCDPCPLDANTDACLQIVNNDFDGDGYLDNADNCPLVKNDQKDTDEDGKGDTCDACPYNKNEGNVGCPTTIHEIKASPIFSTTMRITKAIVSAKSISTGAGTSAGFYIIEENPTNISNSAIFVFTGVTTDSKITGIKVGDQITFDGILGTFNQQLQFSKLQNIEVFSDANKPIPAPIALTLEQLQPSDPNIAGLDGQLVKLANARLKVSAINADYGTIKLVDISVSAGDTPKEINAGVQLFKLSTAPKLGAIYTDITGILRKFKDTYEISLREEKDLANNSTDKDDDGYPDDADNCPNIKNENQQDSDTDGIGDLCDNCINLKNKDQQDSDKDGKGDVCDTEKQADGSTKDCKDIYNPGDVACYEKELVISEIFVDPNKTPDNTSGNDNELEWVKLYNGGSREIDLSSYSLAWSNGNNGAYADRILDSRINLKGKIGSKKCILLGGPKSNTANASPRLSGPLPASFVSPFLFNYTRLPGRTSDGQALFQPSDKNITISLFYTPLAEARLQSSAENPNPIDLINATRAPVDLIVYSKKPSNESMFIKKYVNSLPIKEMSFSVDAILDGKSIRRKASDVNQFEVSTTTTGTTPPTPNECPTWDFAQ